MAAPVMLTSRVRARENNDAKYINRPLKMSALWRAREVSVAAAGRRGLEVSKCAMSVNERQSISIADNVKPIASVAVVCS